MRSWMKCLTCHAAGWLCGLLAVCPSFAADAPKPAEGGTLVVIDSAGKEQKLKTWKFVHGTQRLAWLAPAKAKDKDAKDPDKSKPAAGPEALLVREENST